MVTTSQWQLSSESSSSDGTQKGSKLPKMQEMLDTDEEQTTNIDTHELSELALDMQSESHRSVINKYYNLLPANRWCHPPAGKVTIQAQIKVGVGPRYCTNVGSLSLTCRHLSSHTSLSPLCNAKLFF